MTNGHCRGNKHGQGRSGHRTLLVKLNNGTPLNSILNALVWKQIDSRSQTTSSIHSDYCAIIITSARTSQRLPPRPFQNNIQVPDHVAHHQWQISNRLPQFPTMTKRYFAKGNNLSTLFFFLLRAFNLDFYFEGVLPVQVYRTWVNSVAGNK